MSTDDPNMTTSQCSCCGQSLPMFGQHAEAAEAAGSWLPTVTWTDVVARLATAERCVEWLIPIIVKLTPILQQLASTQNMTLPPILLQFLDALSKMTPAQAAAVISALPHLPEPPKD